MFKIFLYLTVLSFLQVHQVMSSSILSCELAISPFENLKCLKKNIYHITPVSVTYLVKRGDTIFQLKVKNLSKKERELYIKKKEEILKNEQDKLKETTEKNLKEEENNSKVIKKEVVSPEEFERIRKIETDSNPNKNKSGNEELDLNVDDNIDEAKKIELENIKKEETTLNESEDLTNLKKKVEKELTKNKEIEEMDFINSPFIAAQMPKKIIIELNEAKIYLKLNGKRHFQKIFDENIFAGCKIFLLEHFEKGTLREFMLKDQEKPEEERFFKNEISKMSFFDKLTKAVVDLHTYKYIHTNLSPDNVFVNDEMEPVLGGFEFVHEDKTMSQLDPSFFITEGEYIYKTKFDNLEIGDLNNFKETTSVKGNEITSVNVSVVKEDSEAKKRKDEGVDSKEDLEFEVKLKFSRSLEYLAPELILPDPERTFYFNNKLDTYSLGCIYYFMLYGEPPFKGESKAEMIRSLGTRFIILNKGTFNNSISLFENSLNLIPDGRTSTYYFSIQIGMELAREFKESLQEDIRISTDFEYTNKYGRDFFDKYSEMIFVLVMAFVIIPLTVFLASYKFKVDNQNIMNREANNPVNQNPPINMNQVALNNRQA